MDSFPQYNLGFRWHKVNIYILCFFFFGSAADLQIPAGHRAPGYNLLSPPGGAFRLLLQGWAPLSLPASRPSAVGPQLDTTLQKREKNPANPPTQKSQMPPHTLSHRLLRQTDVGQAVPPPWCKGPSPALVNVQRDPPPPALDGGSKDALQRTGFWGCPMQVMCWSDAGLEHLPRSTVGSPLGSGKFQFCWRKRFVPGWIFMLWEAELESRSQARKEKLQNRSGEEGRPGSKTTLLTYRKATGRKHGVEMNFPK